MPVALMGFVPFRAFPSDRSRLASRRSQPSWRWLGGARKRLASGCRTSQPWLPRSMTGGTRPKVTHPKSSVLVPRRSPSGRSTSVESVSLARGVSHEAGLDALLGFVPLQGAAPPAPGRAASGAAPPMSLLARRFRRPASRPSTAPSRRLYGVSLGSGTDTSALTACRPS
jgi:hypothetical protein